MLWVSGARALSTSTMVWTPFLLPLLTLCTGAVPGPWPHAQPTQDLRLGLPQTLNSAQHNLSFGSLGMGSRISHQPLFCLFRLRCLWWVDSAQYRWPWDRQLQSPTLEMYWGKNMHMGTIRSQAKSPCWSLIRIATGHQESLTDSLAPVQGTWSP